MTRVATNASFQSALLDLQRAQSRQQDAQNRIATGKIATDLSGFGRSAETLNALKAADARLAGFMATGETVKARLDTQALAFDRLIESTDVAREAIANALAAGRFDGLMLELEGAFQAAQGALNLRHEGSYLFAGGRTTDAPVEASNLAELAAEPTLDDVFSNDQLISSTRLDETMVISSSFLASDIGGPLMEALRAIQAYHTGPNGPISGALDDADKAFLAQQVIAFDAAREHSVLAASRNGARQNQMENLLASQEAQQLQLAELIGNRTDADVTQAVTDLNLSQIAIQASAQVINQLRDVSLLNLLR
ncbi:MAG TPA: flagellin [Brevundimonas sp.]|jgi:flagellar hook-associated protein 3 FlgL|uniref:flagellin n=1 Tax=Brevundimonas sp. TaxID=1871086 RepID=UPI002C6335C1|nr:flagellin [Brevundimonas sp.]HRH21150.1 flagellin [Brevundimonas sp.]